MSTRSAPPPGLELDRQRAADDLYLAELEAARDRTVTQIEGHRQAMERLGGKLDGLQSAIDAFRKTRPPTEG